MQLLKVENLHFSYGSFKVLKGISLTAKANNMIGIIGGNGSGKTTLLKNISGYLKADMGHIYIGGQNINILSPKKRAQIISYVPQNMPDNFKFTCYDLVMMGRFPFLKRFEKEGPNDRQIVKDSMKMTNSWRFRNRTINQLSGGERQRVYIARALAQKPKILLMDEPISNLDLRYQIDLLSLARDLSREKILVILVLHDINLASQFCDKILIMKDGRVMDRGKPKNVLTAKNIKLAFQVDVDLIHNPKNFLPYVVPSIGTKKIYKMNNLKYEEAFNEN